MLIIVKIVIVRRLPTFITSPSDGSRSSFFPPPASLACESVVHTIWISLHGSISGAMQPSMKDAIKDVTKDTAKDTTKNATKAATKDATAVHRPVSE